MSEEKPSPPEDWECCGGGCTPCVWDRYYDQLNVWHNNQAKAAAKTEETGQQKTPDDVAEAKPDERQQPTKSKPSTIRKNYGWR